MVGPAIEMAECASPCSSGIEVAMQRRPDATHSSVVEGMAVRSDSAKFHMELSQLRGRAAFWGRRIMIHKKFVNLGLVHLASIALPAAERCSGTPPRGREIARIASRHWTCAMQIACRSFRT